MEQLLINKLHQYITENNPDLLLELQQHNEVTGYLESKVAGVMNLMEELLSQGQSMFEIEEQCLEELTADLRPSRYLYIREILAEEFEPEYVRLLDTGLLVFELLNLVESSKPVFEELGFTSENEEDRHLRYAITGTIREYFETRAVTTEN
jgi:hypothetical protein